MYPAPIPLHVSGVLVCQWMESVPWLGCELLRDRDHDDERTFLGSVWKWLCTEASAERGPTPL